MVEGRLCTTGFHSQSVVEGRLYHRIPQSIHGRGSAVYHRIPQSIRGRGSAVYHRIPQSIRGRGGCSFRQNSPIIFGRHIYWERVTWGYLMTRKRWPPFCIEVKVCIRQVKGMHVGRGWVGGWGWGLKWAETSACRPTLAFH